MHLIPPDCSRAEAVVRIAHSLQAFQQNTDQILSRAVQRAGKCRDRLDQLVSRVELLERKLDVLDQMEVPPVLHCAAKYPELSGTSGLQEAIFESVGWQQHLPGQQGGPPLWARPTANPAGTKQAVKDGFIRKQNVMPSTSAKRADFNSEKLAKTLAMPAESPKLELGHFLTQFGQPETTKSASSEIDFSESILPLCDLVTDRESSQNQLDSDLDLFANESADISELIELDLPEDLPGLDLKSLGTKSSSIMTGPFQSEASLSAKSRKENLSSSSAAKSNVSLKKEEKKIDSIAEQTASHSNVSILPKTPQHEAPVLSPPPVMAIIPPPPPPPPPPTVMAVSTPKVESGRADLMAAIRATGGVKGAGLKKVEKLEENETGLDAKKTSGSKKPTESPKQEEDLMTSLARVLAMRRKGISGKKSGSATAGSALESLRERIPTRQIGGVHSDEEQQQAEDADQWKES